VDGRKDTFVLEFNKIKNEYQLKFSPDQLKTSSFPQVLGAALGFVATAEEKFGLGKSEAFDFVEKAFEQAGYQPSIHVDDNHGIEASKLQALYDEGKESELVQVILSLISGCGFAKYHYEEKANSYIEEAINRGWIIQVLTGEHQESGAYLNKKENATLDVAKANKEGATAFNQDDWFVAAILREMGKITSNEQAVVEAHNWLTETYLDVVIALKGVSDKSEIKTNN